MSKINKKLALFVLVLSLVVVSVGAYGLLSDTPPGPDNQNPITDDSKNPGDVDDSDQTPDDGTGTADGGDQTDNPSSGDDGTTPTDPDDGSGTGTDDGTDDGSGDGSGTGTGDGGGVAPLSFVDIILSSSGSMTATTSSPTFILTFDRGLTDYWTANQGCFKIYMEGSATNVLDAGAVTMIDKNNIQLAPTGLVAGASYTIVVSASLQANNGNTLGTDLTKTFTVAPAIGGTVTATVSGTASIATEADIVAGGKTIIVALTDGTFSTQIASLDSKREALIDGLTAGSDTAEWDKVIAALKAAGASAVTRDSDTQVTITLPAVAGYDIASNQTITLNIPSGSISGVSSAVLATPGITIASEEPALTAAVSGTASSATEADIVAGGKTIIVTLTNGTFGTKIASDPLKRDALFDGLTAGSDTAEWDKVIAALKAAGASAVTRDSDTQVTITLPAVAGYDIASNQTITLNIPSGSISGVSSTVTATPTMTIKAAVKAALSGSATSATEADIVTGGKTIVITLSNGTFATKIASDPLKRDALFDGLTAGSDTTEWAKVIAALKAAGASAVTRDSDTQVTITLPAVAGYNIASDQTITLNIPSGSISGVSSTVTASPVFTIKAAAAVALSGTALSATEAEIAAGGKTIVLTLTNGTFATKIASDPLKRDALFDGLTAGSDTAEWAEVIAALKAAGTSAVARNSDTQVTITLPAVAGYDISGDQTITLSIPSGSISGVSSTVTATPTVTITATLV